MADVKVGLRDVAGIVMDEAEVPGATHRAPATLDFEIEGVGDGAG